MNKLIRKILPAPLKDILKLKLTQPNYKQTLHNLTKVPKKKRLILLGTPAHGNLGDHAIAQAENVFFREHALDHDVIEILTPLYNIKKKKIKACIKKNDVIIITGGGWLGSLWIHNEIFVRDIIKSYPDNKIIIFPQTIFYEKTPAAEKELSLSKTIFSNHEKLNICVREANSYEVVRKNAMIPIERLFLIPDMALYLNKSFPTFKRDGVGFCLRKDREKEITNDIVANIMTELDNSNIKQQLIDTIVPHLIPLKKRDKELEKKYEEFKRVKLIITDRLHGMLFSAITGTACIAFDNLSGKVKGVHSWISNLSYIHFVDDKADIQGKIEYLLNNTNNEYPDILKSEFDKLLKLLQ